MRGTARSWRGNAGSCPVGQGYTQEGAVIRATTLYGRPVVDLDAAEKLGAVTAVLLHLETRRLGGLVLSPGQAFLGQRQQIFLPASAIHSIGPDAIVVRGPRTTGDEFAFLTSLAALPRLSDLTGRKLVTDSGVYLGVIVDVLVDEVERTVLGYAFDAANT